MLGLGPCSVSFDLILLIFLVMKATYKDNELALFDEPQKINPLTDGTTDDKLSTL